MEKQLSLFEEKPLSITAVENLEKCHPSTRQMEQSNLPPIKKAEITLKNLTDWPQNYMMYIHADSTFYITCDIMHSIKCGYYLHFGRSKHNFLALTSLLEYLEETYLQGKKHISNTLANIWEADRYLQK